MFSIAVSIVVGGLITVFVAWLFFRRAEKSTEKRMVALERAAQDHMNWVGRFLETFAWRLGHTDIYFSRDDLGDLGNAGQTVRGQTAKAQWQAMPGKAEPGS